MWRTIQDKYTILRREHLLDFCLSVKINNSLKKIIITPKNRKESHKTLSEMFDPNTSQTEK